MLTKRGSPLVITSAFLNCEFHHKVKIDLKLLDRFRTDTDTILFIDLIKRMIKKDPNQRETCENLIDHAALKSHKGRVEIVQHLADKCFYFKIFCFNEYLVKMMNKKEVHMEGSLGEDSDSWKDLLAEVAKLPKNSDPKLMGLLTEKTNLQKNQPGIACSRLLNIFKNDVTIINCYEFEY